MESLGMDLKVKCKSVEKEFLSLPLTVSSSIFVSQAPVKFATTLI
jgi:hypothetical protein